MGSKKAGKSLGWKAIEGYPYEQNAYQTHGKAIAWPGKVEGFVKAGFEKVGPHWLNHPEWERSIYRINL